MIGYSNHPDMALIVENLKKRSQNIFWIDKVPNNEILSYLKASDFFILASKDEGMSNSLLETMSCGLCPIVPRNISGVKDLIQDGANGFFYDIDSYDSLVEKIATISRSNITALGQASRVHIQNVCDVDKIALTHLNFYKRVINKQKVAFCIVVRNEKNNIVSLLNNIKDEYFPPYVLKEIFVYTDASIDGTADLVDNYSRRHPDCSITHIKGKEHNGKTTGLNIIREYIKNHKVFLS